MMKYDDPVTDYEEDASSTDGAVGGTKYGNKKRSRYSHDYNTTKNLICAITVDFFMFGFMA